MTTFPIWVVVGVAGVSSMRRNLIRDGARTWRWVTACAGLIVLAALFPLYEITDRVWVGKVALGVGGVMTMVGACGLPKRTPKGTRLVEH